MTDTEVRNDGLPWLGSRIRSIRIERELSLPELARRAEISRSYLYELEGNLPNRSVPTAGVLFKLARALGVSLADLIEPERPEIADISDEEIPPGLLAAAQKYNLSTVDVRHLAALRFRGQQPQSADRWELLIQQLDLSQALDSRNHRGDEQD